MPPKGEPARADLVPVAAAITAPAARNQLSSQLVVFRRAPFGRTNMADLVRGDGGGFLAGSFAAVLAVLGIYFLTLAF